MRNVLKTSRKVHQPLRNGSKHTVVSICRTSPCHTRHNTRRALERNLVVFSKTKINFDNSLSIPTRYLLKNSETVLRKVAIFCHLHVTLLTLLSYLQFTPGRILMFTYRSSVFRLIQKGLIPIWIVYSCFLTYSRTHQCSVYMFSFRCVCSYYCVEVLLMLHCKCRIIKYLHAHASL